MKAKKNPKKDLNKNSGLYFAIGLMLALCLTFIAFEWKTYDSDEYIYTSMHTPDNSLLEDLPPLIVFKTPPPPVIVTPSILDIIPDDGDQKETDFDVIEPDMDTAILEINDIPDVEVDPEINVTWRSIEEAPVFPGCEDEKDKKACFQEMMNKHIKKVFRYPEEALEIGLEGKVFTQFTIQADGTIGEVRLRGPHKVLEKESARIIGKLPKMKPGKQRDQHVKVAFTIPIIFRLQ